MTTLNFAGAVLASLIFPPAGAVVAYNVGVVTALIN